MKRIWNVGFVLLIILIKIRIYINIVNVVIIVEILTFADRFDDRALIMWRCVVAFYYRGLHHSHDLSRVPAIRIIRNSYDDEWFSTNACSTVYSISTCHPLFYFQPRVKCVIAWNSKRLFFEQEKRKGRKNDGEKTKYEARRKAWIFRSNTWRERWTARNLPLNLENFLSDGHFSGSSGYYDPPLIIIISIYRHDRSIKIEIIKAKFPSYIAFSLVQILILIITFFLISRSFSHYRGRRRRSATNNRLETLQRIMKIIAKSPDTLNENMLEERMLSLPVVSSR